MEEGWAGCSAALRHCQLQQPVAHVPLQPGSSVHTLSRGIVLELVWESQVNIPGSHPVISITALLCSVVIFVLLQCKHSIYSISLKVLCLRTRKHQTILQNIIKYISYRISMC